MSKAADQGTWGSWIQVQQLVRNSNSELVKKKCVVCRRRKWICWRHPSEQHMSTFKRSTRKTDRWVKINLRCDIRFGRVVCIRKEGEESHIS
jgi:hypothetical protein